MAKTRKKGGSAQCYRMNNLLHLALNINVHVFFIFYHKIFNFDEFCNIKLIKICKIAILAKLDAIKSINLPKKV